MDIGLTREIVESALNGSLAKVDCVHDPIFHLDVPKSCPGVPDPAVLNPRNTWSDKAAYDERARKLAAEFCVQFDKAYGKKNIDAAIAAECPGK
jgi:phosphoenolpyruvate carboxykinase (ATP)